MRLPSGDRLEYSQNSAMSAPERSRMKLRNMRIITLPRICRCLSCAFVTACLLFAFLFSARAFFPTNARSPFGLLGKTHEAITTEAITELDQEFFGINRLTSTMEAAIKEIWRANADVDDDQKTAAKHFDGESFSEGQARIINLRNGTIMSLQRDDAQGARIQLGSALHTIQDFYSHSNWVELDNTAPHPGLGRPGNALNRLPATTATCRNCTSGGVFSFPDCSMNLITNGLTSGYYGGEDPPFDVKPSGKCSHGGPLDSSARGRSGEGINKDSTSRTASPHDFLHNQAAAVAKEATKQFIRDIQTAVTPQQLRLLLGAGSGTMGFVIDTTANGTATDTSGGMGSILDAVKEQAIQIVNARVGTDEEPSQYVLVPFNDPDIGPVTVTTDANVFINALNALSAHGGGDCPELSQAGMVEGLAASEEGGELFMFTDASSKDSALTGTVCSLATSKDIRIYPILFGRCSSSIDPSYIKEADDSGGQLFSLSSSEAGSITELADFIVRSKAVNLLLINDTFNGTARTYTVPVDSTMTRIIFSISGTTSVVVRRPTGAVVQASDPDVRLLLLSNGTIYSITNPAVGGWSVDVNGTGDVSIEVSGESSLNLSSFNFVELGGGGAHQGLFPIEGLPLAGQEGTVDAVMSGDFSTAQFELRNETGTVLQTLALSTVPETTDEFSGQVTPPNSTFRVYVTGQDSTGANYQRLLSGSIRPQTVQIDAPMTQDLRPGESLTYTFTVTNLGAPDTFSFAGSDDENYLTALSPTAFSLNSGESADVTLQLQAPPSATPGTSDILTVNVVSTGAIETSNFAVVISIVTVPNQPPDCSQARPSVTKLSRKKHKLVPVSILGVTDPDGDPVSIRIDQIMQDEPVTGSRDERCPDGTGVGSSTAMIRAESSRRFQGRTYTITFTASDGHGGDCQGSVKVCVPYRSQGRCAEDAPAFDSTSCGPVQ
jgi:hypothetical protein